MKKKTYTIRPAQQIFHDRSAHGKKSPFPPSSPPEATDNAPADDTPEGATDQLTSDIPDEAAKTTEPAPETFNPQAAQSEAQPPQSEAPETEAAPCAECADPTNPNIKSQTNHEKDENIQPNPDLLRHDGHHSGAPASAPEPASGDNSQTPEDILQAGNTSEPDTTGERPRAIPRREYTLWELIRHRDYDTIYPDEPDPDAHVLASIRPSAWGDR